MNGMIGSREFVYQGSGMIVTMEEHMWTPWDGLMVDAYRAAQRSPDPSTQNGAVLVGAPHHDPGDWAISGCNEFPDGVSRAHWDGPKEGKYARVVHAEVSVLLKAAREGVPVSGSTLVCPWAACSNCAKHIAYSGVKMLVRHKFLDNGVTTSNPWYEDCLIGDEIMTEAGIEIVEIVPVPRTNITLRRDGKIWSI